MDEVLGQCYIDGPSFDLFKVMFVTAELLYWLFWSRYTSQSPSSGIPSVLLPACHAFRFD